MMRLLSRSRASQGGGYLLESFFHSLLLLFLLLLTLFMFGAGVNTMVAGRASNETMIYTSGSGVWTARTAQQCIAMLPGPLKYRDCRLYRQDPDNPTRTLPGGRVPEICSNTGDYTLRRDGSHNLINRDVGAAEGMREDLPVFQGPVGDCLNLAASGGSRFTTSADSQNRLQPLRLEVRYRQFFFNLCPFLPQARDQIKDRRSCDRTSERIVTRNVVFYSQTVRES